jgi:DNA-binding NarL/FixJ family response regulator
MSESPRDGFPKRIFIVDDHPIVREGLVAHLAELLHLELCGFAEDIAEAIRQINEPFPDLVLVDLSLKSSSGMELVKHLKAYHPSIRVLVWSMHAESTYAERALHAGAHGYIEKSSDTASVISAIETILAGKVYLSEAMAKSLIGRSVGNNTATPINLVERLTDRELETFELLGQGIGSSQIAERMGISPKTVETYRVRIKEKLGLENATQLMYQAIQWVMSKAN